MLVTILSMSSTFGLFLTFNYKSFGFTSIKDDAYLSLIGSLASFVSGCFRLVWGYWFDKYSFQSTTTAINTVLLIGCVIVDYAVESKAAYFFVLVCVFAAFGGNYSIYPPQNVKILGKTLGSRVYFVTNSGFAIGKQFLMQVQSFSILQMFASSTNMEEMDTLIAILFLLECS